jgi:cysteinyl-tRNA synthetase
VFTSAFLLFFSFLKHSMLIYDYFLTYIYVCINTFLCSVRHHFARFVERASSLVKSSNGAWDTHDKKLFDKLMDTRSKVNEGFLNDFDTPSVIRLLQSLVQEGDVYLKTKEGSGNGEVPSEPVSSVSRLVIETLDLFGISSVTHDDLTSSGGNGDDGGSASSAMVQELVKFRSGVRDAAKKALANKTDSTAASKALAVEVLKICDELRDNALPGMGIYLEDRSSGSIISTIPPKTKK